MGQLLGGTFFRKDSKMMMTTEVKPLHPLTSGIIVIVGGKASNFDEEIRTHPRIVFWDSQEQHWSDKDLPSNAKAVFVTRWIGHTAFAKILNDARKRHITIFNPSGTGTIIRQVKELLDMRPQQHEEPTTAEPTTQTETTQQETTQMAANSMKGHSKLNPLMEFVDSKLSIADNARNLHERAKQMGIQTTVGSIAQRISYTNRKRPYMERPGGRKLVKVSATPTKAHTQVDVVVEILDNMVKELQDMREFLIATTEENKVLKARFEHFKKALGE